MPRANEAKSGEIRRDRMLISDAEIKDRFGDKAREILAALDTDRATQINDAMWKGKRFRPAVDAWLEANQQDEGKAADVDLRP